MQIIFDSKEKSIVRLDKGEDCFEVLQTFAKKRDKSFTFSIIGACSMVDLSYYDLKNKKYQSKVFDQKHIEIVSVTGNIAFLEEEILPHMHGIFSNEKYETFGGHINQLIISATGEVVVDWLGEKITRKYDEETGLKLMGK